jgi:hypothetical protein
MTLRAGGSRQLSVPDGIKMVLMMPAVTDFVRRKMLHRTYRRFRNFEEGHKKRRGGGAVVLMQF